MDGSRFDRLAPLFAGRLSRRRGLASGLAAAGALAASIASPATPASPAAARRAPAGPPSRRPRPTGPCGDRSPQGNRCKANKDCCTNYCRKFGDGRKIGRCRCIRLGRKCTPSQECCGAAFCHLGKCMRRCTVCASGCPFTSVEAAYAAAGPGAVITIGPGTYPTSIIVTKDVTLQACGDAEPVLVPNPPPDSDSYAYVISGPVFGFGLERSGARGGSPITPAAVTLVNLTISGASERTEILLRGDEVAPIVWTLRGCTVTGGTVGLATLGSGHVLENSTFTRNFFGVQFFPAAIDDSLSATGCAFSENTELGLSVAGGAVTVTNCTITGNGTAGCSVNGGNLTLAGCTVTGNRAGGCTVVDGALTLASTTVSGNSNLSPGGGIYVETSASSGSSRLTFTGSTVVTGNTAVIGSGVAVSYIDPLSTVLTGVSSASVYGNTGGDQCELTTGSGYSPVTNCQFI